MNDAEQIYAKSVNSCKSESRLAPGTEIGLDRCRAIAKKRRGPWLGLTMKKLGITDSMSMWSAEQQEAFFAADSDDHSAAPCDAGRDQSTRAYDECAGLTLRQMLLAFDRATVDGPAGYAAGVARRMAKTSASTIEDVGCKAFVAVRRDTYDMLESIKADRGALPC